MAWRTRYFICAVALALLNVSVISICGQDLNGLYLPREGRSRGATSTKKLVDGTPDPGSNSDNFRVKPGETHVMLDAKGPGKIQHIWVTFLGPGKHEWAPEGSANHNDMLLKMYWDGVERPQVETPLGDFFAAPMRNRAEVVSIPVQVESGDGYNCFWPMPFAKSARIEIENQSEKDISLLYYNVDWVELPKLEKNTPYFHARYRQEFPVKHGEDYVILETEGRGHYIGTVFGVRTRSPEWFGEGDVKIWIDDDKVPSTWGTGTEDYFLSAWGLVECSLPYFGVPYTDGFGVFGGKTAVYRWHIADPIVFQKHIKIAFEHFGWMSPDENPDYKRHSWNEREDDFSSVAFWYQTGESTARDPIPSANERKPPQLDYVMNAYQIMDVQRHGAGTIEVQDGDMWTSGAQVLYRPESQESAWLEIPFAVQKKEPLRLVLGMTSSYDFGNYAIMLDGVKLRDGAKFHSREIETKEVHLLDFWPEPGLHTVRLECVGKEMVSRGHYLGIDSLRLRTRRPRVAEWAHDRDKNWKAEKILY